MKPILFYDGTCALCHGLVRWVVAHDANAIFAFAPLQGATFAELVKDAPTEALPDSVVVRDEAGNLHTCSDAVIFLLRKLGWRRWATTLAIVPRPLRDLAYGFVAKVRYRAFGRTAEICPIMPAELRRRFLA